MRSGQAVMLPATARWLGLGLTTSATYE